MISTERRFLAAGDKTGREGLIVCSDLPVCQSIGKSLSSTVQRLSVQVCMSAANISRHSRPVTASLMAARKLVDVSGEGCGHVIFDDNLRAACDTIDSGQY